MPNPAKVESRQVGAVKITYLPDGVGRSDPFALFPDSTDAAWKMYSKYLDEDGQFVTTLGAFLLEAGDRRMLVDTGIGPVDLEFPDFGTYGGGKLLDSLAEAGVEPEQVTDVLFTHLHVDHCGWTTVLEGAERRLTFPNAQHRVTQVEWDHWHGGNDPAGPDPEAVQKFLEGNLEFVSPGDELLDGVTVLATPGHTPGHISLVVESEGERAVLSADTLYGAIHVMQPDWKVAFDADPEEAEASRMLVLKELAVQGTLGACGHFTNSAFGELVGTGLGRLWHVEGD